ncbi:MAG: beta-ketoacyl-[acyl-carrier-protein] synthase family protein [Phycisphaerae bacterium]
MKHRRPAVTGMGSICAAGTSLDRIVESMYAGRRGISAPRNIRVDLDRVFPVFEVLEPLEELHHTVPAHEATRTTLLALIAAEEALRHAGLDRAALRRHRVGVCLGTTVGCTLNDEPFYRTFRMGGRPEMAPIHRYRHNNPALFLAETLDLSGPTATVANACSSGTDAIGLAKTWIETDACDIAIAGGCDELSRIPYLGFIHLLIASQHPCRPFDRNRKGLNLGEGAGVVVLECEATASKRGAVALARVAGYASFADAHHPTAPHPDGVGLKRAIRAALGQADVDVSRVGFVNAHGTATPDNDRVEGRVIRDVLGADVPIVATKAFTGHTLGAAGGLEAVFAVRALMDQRLPATVGFEEADPEIGVHPAQADTTIDGDVAISNSLAFGGNNSVLVFQR